MTLERVIYTYLQKTLAETKRQLALSTERSPLRRPPIRRR